MDRVEYQSLIVQDLVNLERLGELNLTPWYQRRSVWTTAQKSYLINTLHENKPVPAIYIRHSLDLDKGKSIKEVVDGQQRTRTILSYCKDEFAARHPAHARRQKYSHLTKEQQHKFLLTSISVGYLLGANDSDVIDIFGRINSVSKSLNAQEKRNAEFSGEFKQFCLKQASSRIEFWRKYNLFTANDISRMNEIQYMSDIVLNLIYGLSDYSSTALDKLYGNFEEEFPQADDIERRLDKVFDFIVSLDASRITDTIFSRQPIFFSLFLILDSTPDLSKDAVEFLLTQVDERFNAEENKTQEDIDFYNASTSTTQRIAQRKVRDQYIRSFMR